MKERKKAGGKKHSLNKLFIPSLLCLAMFPASFAMASASGGEATDYPYANTYRNLESASGNKIVLTGETAYNNVLGGYEESTTGNAVASNNTVTISSGSEVSMQVAGGFVIADSETATATANNNSVAITDSAMRYEEAGGDATYRTTRDDERRLGVVGAGAAAEGVTATATASNNAVTITNSVLDGMSDVRAGGARAGGVTATAITNNNRATITDSDIDADVYGASALAHTLEYTDELGPEEGGEVIASDPVVVATANSNRVAITDSTVGDHVYGGYAETYAEGDGSSATATANNNTVTITDSTVGDHVYGGYADTYAEGDNSSATATASNNTVAVTGSEVGVSVQGGYADAEANGDNSSATATANNNTVTITDSTVGRYIYGGYADAEANGENARATATASNNTVTITGTTVGGERNQLVAGEAYAEGNSSSASATATANNNTFTITDSEVNADVYGGYADAWDATQNRETASYNTVTIDSSTVAAGNLIAGGVVYVDDENNTVTATHNTVNLTGAYDVTGVSLYGGYDDRETGEAGAGAGSDLFTGNTLNLDARNIEGATSVGEVANFETINIRAGNVKNGDTILETNGTTLGNEDGTKATTVNFVSVESKDLQKGDTLILISNAEGILANDGETQFVKQGDGVATGYDTLVSINEDGDVEAEFKSDRKLNPETKVLSESRAASMALINSGTDLLLAQAAMESNATQSNMFGAIRGGHIRNKTGSSIEVDGVNLITGVSHTFATSNGDIKAGAFIEAGWGDTATKNAIGGNKQRGEGKSNYYGAGLMGRYTLQNGIYTEGSIRMGKLDSDYHNSDVRNVYGKRVSYDTDSMYYGAHLGVGYQWKLCDTFSLDTSAKYMWARVDSDSVSILGERYHFDSMNSHRTRLGARLDYTANPQYTPYIGVAWEHEFDGEAGGRVEGYKLDEADAGGSSGIVMLGVDFKPTAGSPFTLNAGVTGYFGQNEGVAGQFKMNYAF